RRRRRQGSPRNLRSDRAHAVPRLDRDDRRETSSDGEAFFRGTRIKCREIPTNDHFCMLRTCNTLVAPAGATLARLTMNFEIATLHSTFAPRRSANRLTFCSSRAERTERLKRMFCDVFGHFHRGTVA